METDDLMRERLGVFRGFGESRYEVVSDVLIPYRERRHVPLQGGYLVVSVEDFDGKRCGVLGRVIRAYPIGDLLGSAGDIWSISCASIRKFRKPFVFLGCDTV
ncbi:MAG: hypothetical protein KatS3mg130_0048 [Candidatus Sumerlaea sp.]|nr:MAG: hypothetical protein KatS3mg130_0048 [Candidatus Sumerlaea sp.]